MAFADPDIAAFRAQLAATPRGVQPDIAAQRAGFEAQHAAVPLPPGCEIAPIAAELVRGERITPAGAAADRVLLYHHGGGYMFGSPRSHRHLVARLAEAAGVTAFNMAYRLSPEAPFPAALDDAERNYRHLLATGVAPDRIVVGGESAGGNLTLALLLRLRAVGLPAPAGAYLLSPWLDMTQSGASYQVCADRDPMLTLPAMTSASQAFLGATSADDPLASPLKADPAGLPPLLIQVGADEVLLSDALDLATRAGLAGVDVTLRVWPHMVHAWPLFHPTLPTSGLAAIAEAGAWIHARLA